jgi:hypothetical protein
MAWTRFVAYTENMRYAYKVLDAKPEHLTSPKPYMGR